LGLLIQSGYVLAPAPGEFTPSYHRALWSQTKARLVFRSSRQSTSKKNSDPTLQGRPGAASVGPRQKSAFAQAIDDSGRGTAILEKGKIPQKT